MKVVGSVLVARSLLGMAGLSAAASEQPRGMLDVGGKQATGAWIEACKEAQGARADPGNCKTSLTRHRTGWPPDP